MVFAADDARQQLIDQLNQRALGMLEQRGKTIAAITTRDAAEKRKAERNRREQFLRDANAEHERPQLNPDARKEELRERAIWDQALADGLDDL